MIEFMKSIAFEAGEICIEAAGKRTALGIEFKSEKDLVTAVDKKVEDFLREEIQKKHPDHMVVGEERGAGDGEGELSWLIDPIDGTVSFVHGLPGFSISLAFLEQGVTTAAVVYGPLLGQMFSAVRGEGAWLNGEVITVSGCNRMVESVWATGFACIRAGRQDNNLVHFTRIVPEIRDIRRMGSAALDLAYVAAGKLDGFWELSLADYDVAAGVLLVEEAGGEVCDFHGDGQYPQQGIIATNSILTPAIKEFLQE